MRLELPRTDATGWLLPASGFWRRGRKDRRGRLILFRRRFIDERRAVLGAKGEPVFLEGAVASWAAFHGFVSGPLLVVSCLCVRGFVKTNHN